MLTQPTGLYIRPTSDAQTAAVPLLGVDVHATIAGASSEVTLRQRFKNQESTPIEAVYVFPLPTDAAVSGFAAEIAGRRIEGRIEEREKAFEIYDDAMADGHGTYLLDQERPNIFTVSVGNLPPGGEATLELRWVAPLTAEGKAFRFMLPTTVSPRYIPRAEVPEVGQPDAERINPDRLPTVPYGLKLAVDLTSSTRRVESPSHAIRTVLPTATNTHLHIELAHDDVALDRDFVLIIEPATSAPALHVARSTSGERYLQVDFVPDLSLASEGSEVIFVVDCSGSMDGESIEQARRALALCVRALDERDTFDIVRFGSHHESLFRTAEPFNADTLTKASDYIAGTYANLGGTEILAPLQAIYARPTTRPRSILLLTDGQVSNESAVIALAEAYKTQNRVFAFGIGSGVSEHLVKELARVSRGQVELIAPGERIEPKVLRQFGRVRTPALTDITIDWGQLEVEQSPREVPPVFAGDPLVVRARVRSGDTRQITLVAGPHRFTVEVPESALETAALGGPVPTLWARSAIRDLENDAGRRGSSQNRPRPENAEERKRTAIVELARAHSLMSSVTSFVAIEVRSLAERTHGAELRKVPIALTAGWGGGGTSAPQSRGGAPMRKRSAPPPPALAASAFPSLRRAMDHMEIDPAPARRARPSAPREAEESNTAQQSPPARLARPSASAPASRSEASDPLYDLLLLQSADGSFSRAILAHIPGLLPKLEAAIVAHGEANVLTSLVLFILEREHRDRKDEWRAAAEKARRFLEQLEPYDPSDLF